MVAFLQQRGNDGLRLVDVIGIIHLDLYLVDVGRVLQAGKRGTEGHKDHIVGVGETLRSLGL